jgi:thiol:disulfide interchange protein DsbD
MLTRGSLTNQHLDSPRPERERFSIYPKIAIVLLALVLFSLISSRAHAAHVKPDLLANVSAIQPGKPFWLGVRLQMDDGWHVYWKNPGDAGIPTRVIFKLPEGFTAGPLQFPTPRQYPQPGNIMVYGYEGTVLLLSQITPPANLPADFRGDFQANISWLVCADQCIPGKGTASLSLGASATAQPDNRELFNEWLSQLPVDAAHDSAVAGVKSSITDAHCTATVTWKNSVPTQIDFFPDATDDFLITDSKMSSSQNTTTITFTVQPINKTAASATLQCVLGYQNEEGKRRGIIIPVAVLSGNNKTQ